MSATTHRVELQLARVRASLLAMHADLSQQLVVRLGDRLPTTRLIELYCQALDLSPFEEVWLRIQAVAHTGVGDGWHEQPVARSAVRRAWDSIVDEVRIAIAPHGDRELQERLTYELATARATVLKAHVRNAVAVAHELAQDLNAPGAVALYIRQLEVDEQLRGAVYALALAQLGSEYRAVRLPPAPAPRNVRELCSSSAGE